MTEPNRSPEEIVNAMMANDAFSQWLGIRIVSISHGYCQLHMQVRDDMCNGFGIAHGGIAYSIGDSCCSFSINAYGRKSLSVETSVNQFKAIQSGDALTCTSKEESLGKKLSVYTAEITNADGERVAIFKGMYYRSDKRWFEAAEDKP